MGGRGKSMGAGTSVATLRGEGGVQPQLRSEGGSSSVIEPDQIIDSEGNVVYGEDVGQASLNSAQYSGPCHMPQTSA